MSDFYKVWYEKATIELLKQNLIMAQFMPKVWLEQNLPTLASYCPEDAMFATSLPIASGRPMRLFSQH